MARAVDLCRLVQNLTQREIRIEFVKEHLEFTAENSAMANLMLSVMGALAEFERALIRERQREGIAQTEQMRQRAAAGEPKAKLARKFGINRETVCQYLKGNKLDRGRLSCTR